MVLAGRIGKDSTYKYGQPTSTTLGVFCVSPQFFLIRENPSRSCLTPL
jgi:hypothetical protein